MESHRCQIPGYRTITLIDESPDTEIYRAIRARDRQPVILKMLKPYHATPAGLSRYRHEYEMTRSLNGKNVITAHGLDAYEQTLFLVLEDIGGAPLSRWMREWQRTGSAAPPVSKFLALAIGIVDGLVQIHEARMIHKNLTPANIVFNPATGELKIIDFGIATTLSRETPLLKHPGGLEGTLAYLSPEQTGRMNRTVDYRTDFYSLGVTFYELLTGRLPFESADVMELVHAHLARTPVAPHVLNPAIPETLSDLVLKLMAKAPEDRYQSARGLKQDLNLCLQRWQAHGGIPPFELGREDRADHFLIPEKLYGREAAVASLLAAFERVAHGRAELILVTGFPGIGKTAVVHEVHRPITRERGFFIQGKFDQLKRNIPFSAFVEASRDLMGQLLSEDAAEQARWKTRLLSALGDQAQVMVEVTPELETILGPQPAVPELSGVEAQNRFHRLFYKFIAIFATPEHPLVIFLDDLQWADQASLALMQLLMSETTLDCLLLIGAYRDNEVSPAHPLSLALAGIQKEGALFNTINLAPLYPSDINQMIADALGSSLKAAFPLTELAYKITQGNPFFNNQFLKSLYEEGLIAFNRETGSWQCDLAQVNLLALTDDVVEFLVRQLQKLPAASQEAIRLAACIGNSFDLGTLSIVCQRTPAQVSADLWPLLQTGLIISQNSVFKIYPGDGDDTPFSFDTGTPLPVYRFLHDRVQQAAYSLIPSGQRSLIHLRIAQLLLGNTPDAQQEEKLFEIVNHFDQGLDHLTDPAERWELARLNLRAGHKAEAATAFRAAWDYFAIARQLLPEESWRHRYDFTLDLHESSVRAAYLSGNFVAMEALADIVHKEARTILDQVKVFEVKGQALAAQTKFLESVNTGLRVLRSLGVEFPEKPGQTDIDRALEETRSACRGMDIGHLVNLPLMSDPTKLTAMRIMASILASAFLSTPELYRLCVLKQVEWSIKYGNTPASPFCYASYDLVLCGQVGDIEAGCQFGQLALNLLNRMDSKIWHHKTVAVVHSFVTHWKAHVRETLIPLRSAYYGAMEAGDFQFAGYSAVLYCTFAYFAGVDEGLSKQRQEASSLCESISQMKQTTVLQYFQMLLQALEDLQEGRSASEYLKGAHYDEEVMMPRHAEAGDWNGIYYVHFIKLIHDYLFGHYPQAVEDASRMEQYHNHARGFPYEPVFRLFDSLARLAAYRQNPHVKVDELLLRIEANQRKLERWAHDAPMNCLHKFHLVEAERLRTFGDEGKAVESYDLAIAAAKKNGYLRDEAMANELAAAFFLESGNEKAARACMKEAFDGYARWGANAKAAQLKEHCERSSISPFFTPGRAIGPANASGTGLGETASGKVGASLDLATVVKASQAISGEIDLGRLLAQLMNIVMENAGAQRGALILERDGGWAIEAQGDVDARDISVLLGCDLKASDAVSAELVYHVARTRISVLLDDAARSGDFIHDPHIARQKVKSVICTPLINQGRLSGIVYLENNRTTHAFTAERLELLNLLSTQMALSLDNARLYQKAQQELAERRQAELALRESEQRFRTIFDSVNDAIAVYDIDTGGVLNMNATATAMFGYTREEFLRLTVEDRSSGEPPYTQQDARTRMRKAAEEGPQLFEWRAKHKDGRLFWVEVHMRRTLINGQDRLLVVARDITERRKAADELHRMNAFLTSVLENIPHMIFIKDARDLRFVRFNRAGEDLLGYSTNDLLGKNDYDFFPKDQADHFTGKDRAVLCGKMAVDIPAEPLQTRNRGERILHTKKVPILNANGEPEYLLGIAEDITEHRKAEENRRALEERLQRSEKMESLGTLAGGVAHDLNNVLGIVIGYSELLLSRVEESHPIRSDIMQVMQGGERAAAIVQDLLTLARRGVQTTKVVNLNNVIRDCQKTPEFEKVFSFQPNVRINLELETDLLNIVGSPVHLGKTVMNLVSNAVEAMRDGGILTITTANRYLDRPIQGYDSVRPGDYVVLSVSDTGEGIAEDDIKHIFEPFYTKKIMGRSGTGLGLAVVWGTVKDHHGYVDVRSSAGQGSAFTLYFPVTREDLSKEQQFSIPPSEYMGKEESILVVDDVEGQRELATRMLARLNYRATSASSGEAAVEYLKANKVDLVILDMIMDPGMDGLDTYRKILEIHPEQKAIIVSGFSESERVKEAQNLGVGTYVRKPYILERLGLAVRKELDGKSRPM